MTIIQEQISKATIKLLLDEPFYGHFFIGILKDITKSVDTAAVALAGNNMVKLYVNPEFWEKALVTKDFQMGVLKHEILHVVLKHILMVKDYNNKRLFNIAADIVVNQYIERHQLIEGVITLDLFSDLNLKPNESTRYYYNQLNKVWQNYLNKIQCEGSGEAMNDQAGKPNGNTSQTAPSSAKNNSQGKKGKKSKSHQQASSSSKNNKQTPQKQTKEYEPTPSEALLDRLLSQYHRSIDAHKFWEKEFENMSEAERKILDDAINDVIKNAVNRTSSKHRDKLPKGIQQYLDSLLESLKPKVNWRRVLRLFAGSSKRTYLKNTIRRPSKRYGTTPGIKVKNKQKILVAIDTSGSISIKDLALFFGEIYHIWRQGAEILVVECDADIHKTYPYNGRPPKLVHGRGGTDFNPPLEYANKHYRPDAIVYFTDGYAPAPHINSRCPVLWLITKGGINEDNSTWKQLIGRKVRMD